MSGTNCICLEKVGDSGACPVHGYLYASGAASGFATAARTVIDTIELSNKTKCYLNGQLIEVGEILVAHNAGNGLWAISFPKKELWLFVCVTTQDLNWLAGSELVKEENHVN